ncbi:hypothetical protein V6N13_097434 [Hibiscus sabdariffa]
MREPRYPLPRVVLCIHDKVGSSPPHTHRERGATTDDHLFISIPWRNSRRGLFVLPRRHGFPCHRDREETGRNDATAPPPKDFR